MVQKLVQAIGPGYRLAPLVPCSNAAIVAACAWSFAMGLMLGANIALYFAR